MMFGEDPAAAAAAHAPSGWALDRATQLILDTVGRDNKRVAEIAKLIDRADAAADVPQAVDGHGAEHWHKLAERRAGHIAALDSVIRQRNGRIAELEQQLSRETRTAGREIDSLQRELEVLRRNGGANLLRAIDRATAVESELRIAERKLEIADRQRREFLGHSRTANARRAEVERERDDARRMAEERELELRELRARTDHAIVGALEITTTDQLVGEIRRRLTS